MNIHLFIHTVFCYIANIHFKTYKLNPQFFDDKHSLAFLNLSTYKLIKNTKHKTNFSQQYFLSTN